MLDKIWNKSQIKLANLKVPLNFKYRQITSLKTQNLVLIGMRRLGKTTFLHYQAQKTIYKNEQILFIDFDDPEWIGINFMEGGQIFNTFMDDFLAILKLKDIKLVLLDEIQRVKNFSRWLKGLVDNFPKVTFIASGSDAINLSKEIEQGTGRFSIKYLGPLTISEYQKMFNSSNWLKYINDYSMPQGKEFLLENRYQMIVEKQVMLANIKKINLENILKIIAFNPGIKMTKFKMAKLLMLISDAKADSKQINNIINFLIDSQLVIKIPDLDSPKHIKKETIYTLYPYDWNTYKYYQEIKKYEDLPTKIDQNEKEKIVPTKGFVFENMIISNIFSKFDSAYQIQRIKNQINEPDVDLIIDQQKYEIKSFDVLNDLNILNKVIQKAQVTQAKIIHTGKTTTINKIEFLNWIEFLNNIR